MGDITPEASRSNHNCDPGVVGEAASAAAERFAGLGTHDGGAFPRTAVTAAGCLGPMGGIVTPQVSGSGANDTEATRAEIDAPEFGALDVGVPDWGGVGLCRPGAVLR